jgi:hydrogenase-4 component B
MLAPMALLGALCFAIGVAPGLLAPALDRVVAAWSPGAPPLAQLVPFEWLSGAAVALLALGAVAFVALRRSVRRGQRAGTWDCGFAAPTARMQYTASSFAATLVALFGWVLRPRVEATVPAGAFPGPSRYESHVHDVVLDEIAVPAVQRADRLLARFRFIQQGRLHLYVLWILLVLVGLMLWVLPVSDVIDRLFGR